MNKKIKSAALIPMPLLQKLLYFGMLAFTIILPLAYLLLWSNFRCMEVQNILVQSFGLYFLLCSVLVIINKDFTFRWKATDILLILLCAFAVISTIFAINPTRAFYGDGRRGEGLGVILSYYFCFFSMTLLTDPKHKRNIIIAYLSRGVVEGIIGLLQVYDVLDIRPAGRYIVYIDVATGFAEHYNCYGTTVCMLLSITTALYLFSEKRLQRRIGFILSAFFMGTLIGSFTRSAVVGFIAACIFLFVMELIRRRKQPDFKPVKNWGKRVGALTVCFGIVFGIFYFTTDLIIRELRYMMTENASVSQSAEPFGFIPLSAEESVTAEEEKPSGEDENEKLFGFLSDNAGSGRVYIWRRSFKLMKYYWLTGAGVDNFWFAFNRSDFPPVRKEYDVAKAHNEYIHKAVTEGVFSAAAFLGLFLAIFVTAVKRWISGEKETGMPSWMTKALAMAFVAYAVQAFFNYSTLNTTPFFWTLAGMLCFRKEAFSEYKGEMGMKKRR